MCKGAVEGGMFPFFLSPLGNKEEPWQRLSHLILREFGVDLSRKLGRHEFPILLWRIMGRKKNDAKGYFFPIFFCLGFPS